MNLTITLTKALRTALPFYADAARLELTGDGELQITGKASVCDRDCNLGIRLDADGQLVEADVEGPRHVDVQLDDLLAAIAVLADVNGTFAATGNSLVKPGSFADAREILRSHATPRCGMFDCRTSIGMVASIDDDGLEVGVLHTLSDREAFIGVRV